MSTVDHVLAQCGQLRTAWGWLAEAVIPGRQRRNQRVYTESATAKRNALARQERGDRAKLLNAGKVVGGGPAPANVGAIEARRRIATDVQDIAHEMTLRISTVGRNAGTGYRPDPTSDDTRLRGAVDWISLNVIRLSPSDYPILNSAYTTLVDATALAAAVSGCGPQRRPMATECPACGRRSLAWDTSSPEPVEWHVLCTNPQCRCDGRDCTCKLPERRPGMTHVWLESMWERFAEQLNSRDKETR